MFVPDRHIILFPLCRAFVVLCAVCVGSITKTKTRVSTLYFVLTFSNIICAFMRCCLKCSSETEYDDDLAISGQSLFFFEKKKQLDWLEVYVIFCVAVFLYWQSKNDAVVNPRTRHFQNILGLKAKRH